MEFGCCHYRLHGLLHIPNVQFMPFRHNVQPFSWLQRIPGSLENSSAPLDTRRHRCPQRLRIGQVRLDHPQVRI
jgi:hypothetical protein